MWFCKKASENVECVGCGCLMRRAWKVVEVVEVGPPGSTGDTFTVYWEPHVRTEPYCGRCAPPYDIRQVGSEVSFARRQPAQNIEVDEKGKDIKEKRAH